MRVKKVTYNSYIFFSIYNLLDDLIFNNKFLKQTNKFIFKYTCIKAIFEKMIVYFKMMTYFAKYYFLK